MREKILNYSINMVLSVLLSVLMTVLLLAFSAWLMLSGKMTAGAERIALNAIRIISCLAGGFLCGKRNKKRGFLWGLLLGLIYYGILMMLRCLTGANDPQEPLNILTVMLCCLGSGMLGGMLS